MILDVSLHGRRVGTLGQESGSQVVAFNVDPEYVDDAMRPVLGQYFEDKRRVQTFRQPNYPGVLPAYFANLLPEGVLKALIDAQKSAQDHLSTLAYVGGDLPGAVVVREIESHELGSTTGGRSFDEGPLTAAAPSGALRFSLAGVQLKFSAVRDASLRFTLPFSGEGGRWILKFGAREWPGLVENEFAVMRWAQRAGLNVPRHEIYESRKIEGLDPRILERGEQVFAIERFDRPSEGGRIHQEDFAQLRGARPENKYDNASYEGLARLTGDLCGLDDAREFMRRVVFMILSGNLDAHLKNWSLVYPDQRNPRLSPAYDFVFVWQYPVEPLIALPLAKEKIPARITWDHVRRVDRFLRTHGLDHDFEREAREFAARTLDAWSGHKADVEPQLRAMIDRYLGTLPLAKVEA